MYLLLCTTTYTVTQLNFLPPIKRNRKHDSTIKASQWTLSIYHPKPSDPFTMPILHIVLFEFKPTTSHAQAVDVRQRWNLIQNNDMSN